MKATQIRALVKAKLAAAAIAMAAAPWAAAVSPQDIAGGLARGAYLARAADCGACHTAPGGKAFAGGLAISSPVGTIYSSNITPSEKAGIGRYSEAQFARALREGVRADGANLYPAMPYTAYALLTDADVEALYAYFMHSVAAIDQQGPETALPFPLDIRASMKIWNLLFLDQKPFEPDPGSSDEINRGRYLVMGAAHCTACHTPRGFLMQEEAGAAFGGALVGAWYAPNITSDATSGIGTWSRNDLVQYLRSGSLAGKAQAAGSMAEAVQDSFQYLSDTDLGAIAAYIATVPALHRPADVTSRFETGAARSDIAVLRGTYGISADSGDPTGAALFSSNCASCHSFAGQGTKDQYYPSLFRNSTVGSNNPNNLVATILDGVDRTTRNGQAYMPGFAGGQHGVSALSNAQIALVANYVLRQFGSGTVEVTEAKVAEVRRGGPSSPLVWLAQTGVAAGAAIVMIVGFFLFRRTRR